MLLELHFFTIVVMAKFGVLTLLLMLTGAAAFTSGGRAPMVAAARQSSTSAAAPMTMRIGKADLRRRTAVNSALHKAQSTETAKSELFTDPVKGYIEKCNWRLRKFLIRKAKAKAYEFEMEYPAGFGTPPTAKEQDALDQAARRARLAAA